jgi:hypothetical protein
VPRLVPFRPHANPLAAQTAFPAQPMRQEILRCLFQKKKPQRSMRGFAAVGTGQKRDRLLTPRSERYR